MEFKCFPVRIFLCCLAGADRLGHDRRRLNAELMNSVLWWKFVLHP
jgi:hypothetical protein